MNPRKYITDPKILLEEGKAIMTSSDESKYQLRAPSSPLHEKFFLNQAKKIRNLLDFFL